MRETERYIITGPPGSGKTTLLHALRASGFTCIAEYSRQVIREEQKNKLDGTPWGNLQRFTRRVYEKTMRHIEDDQGLTFYDRGLLDTVAYLRDSKLSVPSYLRGFDYRYYYRPLVFYAPPWKTIYTTDPQRPGKFEDYRGLDIQLKKVYKEFGFQLAEIPRGSVESRLKFIVDQLLIHKILLA